MSTLLSSLVFAEILIHSDSTWSQRTMFNVWCDCVLQPRLSQKNRLQSNQGLLALWMWIWFKKVPLFPSPKQVFGWQFPVKTGCRGDFQHRTRGFWYNSTRAHAISGCCRTTTFDIGDVGRWRGCTFSNHAGTMDLASPLEISQLRPGNDSCDLVILFFPMVFLGWLV